MRDLHDAVLEGAVGRVRPKIMTVCAILFGLLPIMWSPATQAGADVMKRIAAPMIGGVVTSAILELLIYPVIYVIWRRRELPDKTEEKAPFIPPALIPSRLRKQIEIWILQVLKRGGDSASGAGRNSLALSQARRSTSVVEMKDSTL